MAKVEFSATPEQERIAHYSNLVRYHRSMAVSTGEGSDGHHADEMRKALGELKKIALAKATA